MNVKIYKDKKEVGKAAAEEILHLRKVDRVNIGLATGNSPIECYRELVEFFSKERLPENWNFYNIDEYDNVPLDLEGTCDTYLQQRFYGPLNIPETQIHRLYADTFSTFEQELQQAGGLDFVMLGIGKNGHIALNEPGIPFGSYTHRVALTEAYKKQHADEFGGIEKVPSQGLTIGIKTIMNSKQVLLIANGLEKAEIIRKALTGPITEVVPASVLQLHPFLTVVLDQEAASGLSL
ncbi:6-phosphogluconolactonase [Weizmannia acidilactici]|uniref:6-phosphogluconolactonase n=1 Tax=Weizmannia acidilactici TaxID=2607726 RepID=UPI00124DACFE|nr:glucosamine-6-phosphate deaminase [Weizmannia acidilactici]GER74677.1 6-phosphogluconolactonase [Weizmannia acidilactici]